MFLVFRSLVATSAIAFMFGIPAVAQQFVTDQICQGNANGKPIEVQPGVIKCDQPAERKFQVFEARYRVDGQGGHVELRNKGVWKAELRIFFNNGKVSDWIRLSRTSDAGFSLFRPDPGQYLSPGVHIQLDDAGFTYRNTSGQTYRYSSY